MRKIDLFTPLKLGPYELANRIVLAPLTRMRAGPGNAPQALNAEYYRQRASAGLIVAEATQVAPEGVGYPNTPGIHSAAQVEGWRAVTKAVHEEGGRIFLQLWHVGRVSHPSMQPGGALPVAPSAIAPRGRAMTYQGPQPYLAPRALDISEIPGIVRQFREGAELARAAGFDGVEVHGANGYLIEQFLNDGSNLRDDAYGGGFAGRARLLFEILDAVIAVWGADRTGLRLSPFGIANDCTDSDPASLHAWLVSALAPRGLAYLHLIEPRASGAGKSDQSKEESVSAAALLRPFYSGTIVAAGGFDFASASLALEQGIADAVAFGRIFIANPDLPRRFQLGAPLNPYDRATFYGGDAKGYTDYPTLEAALA